MAETNLNLKFTVDDSGTVVLDKISAQLASIDKGTQSVGNSLKLIKFDSIINLGERAFRTGEQIYHMAKNVASSLNDIDRMSKVAGMTTNQFQKMMFAAKMTDVEAGDLATGIKKLSMAMEDASRGTGEAEGWFKAMGISVKNSEGNLKPLQEVMGQIADKFAQWEDGPRKIAIAVDLFGRSGQNLIPYLNQGAEGLKRFYEEAERLGVVLDEKPIQKGTELEDKFKRIEAQVSSMWKKIVIGAYEAIEAIEEFRLRGGLPGAIFPSVFEPGEYGLVGPKSWSELQAKKKPTKTAPSEKTVPGDIFREGIELSRLFYEEWKEGYYAIFDAENERLAQGIANAKLLGQGWIEEYNEMQQAEEDRIREGIEYSNLMHQAWMENYTDLHNAEEERIREGIENAKLLHQAWIKKYTAISDSEKMLSTIAQNVSNVWANNVTNMIRGTETFKDAFSNMIKGIADSFISAVSKMITQWLIFGSITGEKGGWGSKGGGWGGILGSLIGIFGKEGGIFPSWTPVQAFQHGGVVNRPTLGMFGERGPEAVIPLKGGKVPVEMQGERGSTNVFYIQAIDTITFRDYVRRNPEAIIEVVSNDARMAGSMRTAIKGA